MSAVQPSYVGLDMVLAYNSANFASPSWVTVNCRDLKMALSQGEADVSCRGSKLKLTEPSLQAREYTFDMVYDETDAAMTAIRSAFLNRTVIEFALANGPIGTLGTVASGGTANVIMSRVSTKIFGFEVDEPLEGAGTVSVTAKPSKIVQTNTQSDNATVS